MTKDDVKRIKSWFHAYKLKADDRKDFEGHLLYCAVMELRKWNGAGSKYGFLYSQLQYRAIDYLRKTGRYGKNRVDRGEWIPLDKFLLYTDPPSPTARIDLQSSVKRWLKKELTEKEYTIIKSVFYDRDLLSEVGERLGVKESRVSQLKGEILQKLGKTL